MTNNNNDVTTPMWLLNFWEDFHKLCKHHDVSVESGQAEIEGAFCIRSGYKKLDRKVIHNKWCGYDEWLIEETNNGMD